VFAVLQLLQTALKDRYVLEGEIGRGGMATVYRAQDLKHDRLVALKVLDPDLAASLGADRFLREIKLIAKLQHPHILPLFDSGHVDGLFFYVMPFMAGDSLRARLNRERILPIEDAVRITGEIASALDYAHRQGIIHRDIKPENILLQDGHAIVADFGVARAITASATTAVTQSGIAVGTPTYMSPEQAVGDRTIDGRSDVYALGCVLYEMLSGEPPFTGPTAQAIIARRFIEVPRPVRRLRNTVPESIDRALVTALALEPSDRFASASQLSNALRGATDQGTPTAASPAKRAHTDSPEAARLYEDAQRIIQHREIGRLPSAMEFLSQATTLDARFGSGYALLAVAHLLAADVQIPADRACDAARSAARAALRIEPALSEAHAALGFAHMLMWEWGDAERELRRAVDLAPSSSLAQHWYGIYLCAAGQLDEARAALLRAVESEGAATNARCALGAASYYARDFDSAVRILRRATQDDPLAATPHILLGMSVAARGSLDDAMREFALSIDRAGELQPFAITARGCALAAYGRQGDALSAREELTTLADRADISPFYGASLNAMLGDQSTALSALARAVEQRDGWMLAIKVHPWLDSLRHTSGLGDLTAQVGL
jgi:tetratricopeptide (TPR) repeat protein/tRNA A-37 threonylcarbamoyl transferase component Bud32